VAADRFPGCPNDPERLKIVVREQPTTTAIELHGEFDLAGLPSIHEAISRVLGDGPECIVLDLSRLAFIDSTGLHATLELTNRSAAQNTRLVIIPGPRSVQRLFEITGLLERLPFIDQRPNGPRDAKSHFAQSGAAGSDAFWPPTRGAGRLHEPTGAAPSGLSLPRRPHSPHAPSAKGQRRPGAGGRP
jgi:anti-anti-sigma factor